MMHLELCLGELSLVLVFFSEDNGCRNCSKLHFLRNRLSVGLMAGSVCIVTLKLVTMCLKTHYFHNNLHDVVLSSW